ncbi:MAG: lysophospholipid acyltransferase family protein [Myxococcaceae bacterium]
MPSFPAVTAGTDEAHPVFVAARQVARAASAWHRARLEGLEYLPPGPALLIGNHGLFGLETLVFFYLLHRHTGRVPVGMTDRRVFGKTPMRQVLFKVGGVPGTRENGVAALRAGRWVVCYPGGAHEVFKSPESRYRLAWDRASGFAKLAIEANVPVVPFAGLGVDDTFVNLGHAPLTKALLGRYAAPVAFGVGPLPLPVQLRFCFSSPITPARARRDPRRLKSLVQAAVEELLEGHGRAAPTAVPAIP